MLPRKKIRKEWKTILCLKYSPWFFRLSFSILVNMDDRMIEQFVDEDDFIINLDFDNQLGHFELTLQYWNYIIYKYFFLCSNILNVFFLATCVKKKYNMKDY